MRVLIVVAGFPPRYVAGTEVATEATAKALAARGHEVHVLTRRNGGETDAGRPYRVYRTLPDIHLARPSTPAMVKVLLTTIKNTAPDVVHCQAFYGHAYAAVRTKPIHRRPVVVYGRGADVYVLNWRSRRMLVSTLKRADAAVAQTRHMADALRAMVPRPISVVPNGVDVEAFSRPREGLHDPPTLLYVGRFRKEKNVALAVEAFRRLRVQLPSARLLLAGGGGEEEPKVRAAAKDLAGVEFLGDVPHGRVPEVMALGDVFVLPSLVEGFPVTALEAMAAGLPVVATDVGGVNEIVKQGETGLLVRPGEAEVLAAAIRSLLGDTEQWERMSSAGRAAAARYSWDAVAARLEQLYEQLLRPR